MATISIASTKLHRGSHQWLWETLTNGDVGGPLDTNQGSVSFADKTIHVVGTFGSNGTVVIEGSNDGTNWLTLNDPTGVALSFTATGLKTILENPKEIRPNVTAGDGTTDLDVYIVCRLLLEKR